VHLVNSMPPPYVLTQFE